MDANGCNSMVVIHYGDIEYCGVFINGVSGFIKKCLSVRYKVPLYQSIERRSIGVVFLDKPADTGR